MIGDLLPAGIEVAIAGPADWNSTLLGNEERAVSNAAGKRRREFAAGRSCARRALARLGVPPDSIEVGEHRQPLWPFGTIGSITHCEGFCAAAAAHSGSVLGVGIDAERNDQRATEIAELIAHAEDRMVGTLPTSLPAELVIFSAKESFFKSWFPITSVWLGFADVAVEIDAAAGTFVIAVDKAKADEAGAVPVFAGRWGFRGEHVFTAMVAIAPSTA
jgi:4'-phosphopantetheinyl transferase EntD